MIIEIISTTILIISLAGLLLILLRKIPYLTELPEVAAVSNKEKLLTRFKNKIKNLPIFKSFSFEIFLQKIISKFRILTLKTERKTSSWLQRLRERTKRKKLLNDNYWQEMKSKVDPVIKKENLTFAHFFKKKKSNPHLSHITEEKKFSTKLNKKRKRTKNI